MKCNPWRWLWGLPLLAMGLILTIVTEHQRIHADLGERSQAALKAAGYDWAAPVFAGRDGQITGRASIEGDPAKAVEVVREVWGVRTIGEDAAVMAAVADYQWNAERQSKALVLSGYVPSEEDRALILAEVGRSFPGMTVVDRMTVAGGVPERDTWLSAVRFSTTQLASLKSGTAALDNLDLSLGGEAENFAAYKGVKSALGQSLPDGVKLAADTVTPPVVDPFTWSAVSSDNQLVLSGHVPSEDERRALFQYAKDRFKLVAIVDRMQTAGGAPEDWSRAAVASIDQLARVQSGRVDMSATSLELSGQVADKAIADAVVKAYKDTVPAVYTADANLTFPEAEAPAVSPYVTELQPGDGDTIVLSGYAPSESLSDEMTMAVVELFPGKQVDNQMKVASGAPREWKRCFMASAGGAHQLDGGSFIMRDERTVVTGRTTDETLAATVPAKVRELANRSCTPEVRVAYTAPPEPSLEWQAVNAGEGKIVLSGAVPDGATKATLVRRTAQIFPDDEIIDRMSIAQVPPRKWPEVAETGLQLLAQLRSGEAVISRQDLLVRGVAKDKAVETAIRAQLTSILPKGYGGRDAITVRSDAMIWAEDAARKKAETDKASAAAAAQTAQEQAARDQAAAEAQSALQRKAAAEAEAKRLQGERESAEAEAARLKAQGDAVERQRLSELSERRREANKCEKLMRSTAAEGVIRFGWASADITPQSRPTLRKLASIANACPQFRIEIEGHTDAEGTPERNKALSERRAKSVVSFLEDSGVKAQRLSGVGYGETRPVAPNDTAANRAKNRRIEFAVIAE